MCPCQHLCKSLLKVPVCVSVCVRECVCVCTFREGMRVQRSYIPSDISAAVTLKAAGL